MKEIILKMHSPQEAAQYTILLFRNGFEPRKAIISYNIRKKLPVKIKNLKDYPLILEGNLNGHDMRVAVTPLSIGFSSDGAYALRKILKEGNFYIQDIDFFSLRNFNRNTGRADITITKG